jgi:hypothetical protein
VSSGSLDELPGSRLSDILVDGWRNEWYKREEWKYKDSKEAEQKVLIEAEGYRYGDYSYVSYNHLQGKCLQGFLYLEREYLGGVYAKCYDRSGAVMLISARAEFYSGRQLSRY